jgi:hypothetical protein
MVFLPIEEPELSLLGDSASYIVSVAPISMAPFALQLLVEITYIDSSKLYKSYYIYDTESNAYTINISDYLGGSDVVSITSIDVAWNTTSGVTFAIAYIDKTESSYLSTSTGNRIAIVQNGVLSDNDIIKTASQEVANTGVNDVVINALGTQVIFSSAANNLVDYPDTNDVSDAFLLDISNATLERVSQITNDDEGSEPAYVIGFSTVDGVTKVLFETAAAEFSTDDLNEANDLYLVTPGAEENTTILISKTTTNYAASTKINQAIIVKNNIVYVSESDELVDGDSNQSQDIFIQNIDTGTKQRLTSDLDGLLGSYGIVEYELLGLNSGVNQLMFSSNYTTLDTDTTLYQIYLMDLDDKSIITLSLTPGQEVGNDTSSLGIMDSLGTNYAYQTQATNLVEAPGGTLITNVRPIVQLFDTNQKGITNLSLDLYKDNNSLDKSVVIDNSTVLINEVVDFDVVKLSATDAYDFDINISDAIDVLRHIVDLQEITEGSNAYHAADVNNDGNINISDAIDILRHIVDLEAIDTFDLIDSDGNRVTQLDANASGEPPIWTLVANGDVDMSGSFAEDYLVASELV